MKLLHRVVLTTCGLVLVVSLGQRASAQQTVTEADVRQAVPYHEMLRTNPSLTFSDYSRAVREVARELSRPTTVPEPWVPTVRPPSSYRQVPPSSGSTYDWRSGNLYNWRRDGAGNTNINGSNLNTGSSWNTKVRPDGSMNGFDSGFNYWDYNAQTGTYMNFGTGQVCVGQGAARVCTGGR